MTNNNIKIALTNLGAYNEGELRYIWLDLPATSDEINEAMQAVGIDGEEYEEYFISDYEAPFPVGEYMNIDRLNDIAEQLEGYNVPSDKENVFEVKAFVDKLESEGIIRNGGLNRIIDEEELQAEFEKIEGWASAKSFLSGIVYMSDDYFWLGGDGNAAHLDAQTIQNEYDEAMEALLEHLE